MYMNIVEKYKNDKKGNFLSSRKIIFPGGSGRLGEVTCAPPNLKPNDNPADRIVYPSLAHTAVKKKIFRQRNQ